MKRNVKKLFCLMAVFFLVFSASIVTGFGVREAEASTRYQVRVESGYLALRTAKAYDSRNEIGKLYTGDVFDVTDASDSQYWYGYSPKLGMYGYVNKDYLVSDDTLIYGVTVATGYLALRTAKAYDSRNEIGKLYNNDRVEVRDTSDSQYWYVYAPSLGKYGYVNKDYLYYISGSSSSPAPVQAGGATYRVSVATGYLALRSAMAYDSRNEIGKLYNGETVRLQERAGAQYWYVYAPSLGKYGYVNKDYLVGPIGNSSTGNTRTVQVAQGYLALRSAKAYDPANEIGKLYSGYTVEVQDASDSQYWYVYAPALGKSGYVNKDYLY